MKKLLLAVLLAALSFGAFAQKTIDQLNGFDWLNYDSDQKMLFVIGFIHANDMMMEYMRYNEPSGWSNDQKRIFEAQIEDQFGYPIRSGEMVRKLDQVYSDYSQRKFPLWQAIMVMYGKDFWNKAQNQTVDPTDS